MTSSTPLTEILDTKITKKFNKASLKTAQMALKPFSKKLFLVLSLGTLGRLSILMNSIIIGKWIDHFCKGPECKNSASVWSQFSNTQFLEILFGITVLGFFLTLYFRVHLTKVLTRALASVYDEVTFRTSRFPMSFFDENPVGKIVTRFSSDYMNVMRTFGGAIAEFVSIGIDLGLIVFLLSLTNIYFLPIILCIGALNFYIYIKTRKSLLAQRQKTSNLRSPGISHFAETLQGAHLIRLHHKSKTFTEKFQILDKEYQDEKRNSILKMSFFSFKMNSLSLILFSAISITSYFLIKNNMATVGAVGAALTLVLLSTNTIQIFFEWLSMLEEALVSFERFNSLLNLPLEDGARLPSESQFQTQHPKYSKELEKTLKDQESQLKTQRPSEKGALIEARSLWFRYKPNLPWVLKDLSFTILPGEKVGIVGKTGSGKSSLIKVLYYLYPLDQGGFFINNHAPQLTPAPNFEENKIDLQAYRRLLSLIPQDPVLFQGSLKENLDPYNEHSEAALLEVLKKIHLNKKISMMIQERGSNLSQGEKQLIALGRCLLMDTPIVIMDEATSSVDPMTESLLQTSMETLLKGKTQIIIAHRLSTLERCDRIMILKEGIIDTLGSPKDLIPRIRSEELLF